MHTIYHIIMAVFWNVLMCVGKVRCPNFKQGWIQRDLVGGCTGLKVIRSSAHGNLLLQNCVGQALPTLKLY